MRIPDEAIAIVASNLTAAHCAAGANPFARDAPKDGTETQQLVLQIFLAYMDALRTGEINHLRSP
jgi:hypothetical protein